MCGYIKENSKDSEEEFNRRTINLLEELDDI